MVRVATFGLRKSLRNGRVQLSSACRLLLTTLIVLPIHQPCWVPLKGHPALATSHRSTATPRLPQWPAAPSSSLSTGMATGMTAASPSRSQRAVTPTDLSFNITATTERGLNLSWIHVLKQLGWSLASPISTSTSDSAHVPIRSPNRHAGITVTNLSLCLYTPLSLRQIQQGMWDANAFTPMRFV